MVAITGVAVHDVAVLAGCIMLAVGNQFYEIHKCGRACSFASERLLISLFSWSVAVRKAVASVQSIA
jgi:hypothetical protein